MRHACARIRRRLASDAGSISLVVVVLTPVIFGLIGLVIDGGGALRAQQRAANAASEAGRAGLQRIDRPAAMRDGTAPRVEAAAAAAASRAYLSHAGIDGSVSIVSADEIQVNTTTTFHPVFLGMIGIGDITVKGADKTELIHGVTSKDDRGA